MLCRLRFFIFYLQQNVFYKTENNTVDSRIFYKLRMLKFFGFDIWELFYIEDFKFWSHFIWNRERLFLKYLSVHESDNVSILFPSHFFLSFLSWNLFLLQKLWRESIKEIFDKINETKEERKLFMLFGFYEAWWYLPDVRNFIPFARYAWGFVEKSRNRHLCDAFKCFDYIFREELLLYMFLFMIEGEKTLKFFPPNM